MSDSDENYAAQIDDSLSDSSLDDPPPPEVVEQPKPIAKKKRVQSPAQKAALEKGRATALANRLARKKEKEDALNAKLKEQKKPKEPEPSQGYNTRDPNLGSGKGFTSGHIQIYIYKYLFIYINLIKVRDPRDPTKRNTRKH